jgi:hypothetical protein
VAEEKSSIFNLTCIYLLSTAQIRRKSVPAANRHAGIDMTQTLQKSCWTQFSLAGILPALILLHPMELVPTPCRVGNFYSTGRFRRQPSVATAQRQRRKATGLAISCHPDLCLSCAAHSAACPLGIARIHNR